MHRSSSKNRRETGNRSFPSSAVSELAPVKAWYLNLHWPLRLKTPFIDYLIPKRLSSRKGNSTTRKTVPGTGNEILKAERGDCDCFGTPSACSSAYREQDVSSHEYPIHESFRDQMQAPSAMLERYLSDGETSIGDKLLAHTANDTVKEATNDRLKKLGHDLNLLVDKTGLDRGERPATGPFSSSVDLVMS
ncbi:hypothetical protein SODALDRAFT_355646 [Sodiomyces alkalinus F11]|uniref:Uncharacterized protein n=1 Tax=Sodiomyces alkalinus (strain CBS 110278 / VKM F-3762 / F11) TaxID=1314773 RepID=A0A3N2Q9V5_SODAK|nr:hypothetical protein SODALDRAFT_355646 [Sodiomyces alkalinus F11]ROT43438.1 hypothetical protein SODALDRAFT_355646 [Sodiomyces alkalinus F11]